MPASGLSGRSNGVEGPAKFAEVLPMPGPVVGEHYRDISVLAFRIPVLPAELRPGHAIATQSSTRYAADADRLIDGNTNGLWAFASFNHTDRGDAHPWWQLDLGEEVVIDEIEVWRRTDGAGIVQLNHADVVVLDAAKKELCRQNLGVVKPPSVRLKVAASPAAKARFVRVEKQGEILSLAEVQVFSGGKMIGRPSSWKRIQDWEAKAVRLEALEPVQPRSGPGSWGTGAPDVEAGSMVQLSAQMDATGRLVWEVPPGSWQILRFGTRPREAAQA